MDSLPLLWEQLRRKLAHDWSTPEASKLILILDQQSKQKIESMNNPNNPKSS
jgi:hypothetical protein